MKKMTLIFCVFAAIPILAALGLAVVSFQDGVREIRTEIDINAPRAEVWAVLTSFEEWDEWNPIVQKASGVAALGSELSITMRAHESNVDNERGEQGNSYKPVITAFEEQGLLRWRAKMIAEFLFANDRVFELEETASGTRLIHREQFDGLFVPLFWGKLNEFVPSMLASMDEALKLSVEEG